MLRSVCTRTKRSLCTLVVRCCTRPPRRRTPTFSLFWDRLLIMDGQVGGTWWGHRRSVWLAGTPSPVSRRGRARHCGNTPRSAFCNQPQFRNSVLMVAGDMSAQAVRRRKNVTIRLGNYPGWDSCLCHNEQGGGRVMHALVLRSIFSRQQTAQS